MSIVHPISKFLPSRPLGPMRAPARALGWFSIGLGLAEMVMPRAVARATGMPQMPLLVRAYGMREIGVGIGMLTSRDPSPWLWSRVAGDVLDMTTVATGLVSRRTSAVRTLGALALLAGVTWIDAKCATAAAPKARRKSQAYNYGDRSGFPRGLAAARGLATPRPPA